MISPIVAPLDMLAKNFPRRPSFDAGALVAEPSAVASDDPAGAGSSAPADIRRRWPLSDDRAECSMDRRCGGLPGDRGAYRPCSCEGSLENLTEIER